MAVSFVPFLSASAALALGVGAVFGAIIGSFLATVLVRWPRGEWVGAGRSHCDACATPLSVRELVPVLSHLAQRGRCRSCGARIAPAHMRMELAAAAIGAISAGLLAATPSLGLPLALTGAMLGWVLLLLAALDLTEFWLPDRLTLPLAAAGLGVAGLGLGPGIAASLIGLAAGYLSLAGVGLVYRAVRAREGLGGGDPKLFAAIGAWLGWDMLPPVLLGACILGLAAVAVQALRGQRPDGGARLPFGALLAAAAWPLWLAGHA